MLNASLSAVRRAPSADRHERKLSHKQLQLVHDAEVDRAYMSRLERVVTHVGLEIIGKLATILEVEPAEFCRRPSKSLSRRKAD